MRHEAKILVVDDEEIVCKSCDRILSKEGFKVDTHTNPKCGLTIAQENKYDAILLDLMMPHFDGIDFLKKLRQNNNDIPVIIITGYPDNKSLQETAKLGVSGYITKPFTPAEITDSVKLATGHLQLVPRNESIKPKKHISKDTQSTLFLDEAWLKIEKNGSIRVGSLPLSVETPSSCKLELPKPGTQVFQGLPFANLLVDDKTSHIITSPVSGKISKINEQLLKDIHPLWNDPVESGWIANIIPDDIALDTTVCKQHNVVCMGDDNPDMQNIRRCYEKIGISCSTTSSQGEVISKVCYEGCDIVVLDEESTGSEGVHLASRLKAYSPDVKIIVLGTNNSQRELYFRSSGIFYYTLSPLDRNETIDIISASLRSSVQDMRQIDQDSGILSKWLSKISVTDSYGRKTTLISIGEHFPYRSGLGKEIVTSFLTAGYPVETTRGMDPNFIDADLVHNSIRHEGTMADRLIIVQTRDINSIPGSITYDNNDELLKASGKTKDKFTLLTIQPSLSTEGALVFDTRINKALARHIMTLLEK